MLTASEPWHDRLMMPSRHFRFGSKTPDPEFPVLATSPINVENVVRNVKGSNCGETMWDCEARRASTTMTESLAKVALHIVESEVA
jgi:hypothetical protein